MSTYRPTRRYLALVACGGSKLDREAPARELYTGDLTRKAIADGERWDGETFILSARYGIVALDETIAPYDQRLDRLAPGELADWAAMVVEQLGDLGALDGVITLHAGATYAAALKLALAGTSAIVVRAFVAPTPLGMRKQRYARRAAINA